MRVARTLKGLAHKNALVLRKVKVYFQLYPGKQGSDADRGIPDAEFILKIGGRVVQKGKTAADGSVEMMIPAGQKAELLVFGTTYDVEIWNYLEPTTDLKGQQRRLCMLGYELGNVDGIHGEKMDRAALQFQADQSKEPDGIIGNQTQSALRTEFGE